MRNLLFLLVILCPRPSWAAGDTLTALVQQPKEEGGSLLNWKSFFQTIFLQQEEGSNELPEQRRYLRGGTYSRGGGSSSSSSSSSSYHSSSSTTYHSYSSYSPSYHSSSHTYYNTNTNHDDYCRYHNCVANYVGPAILFLVIGCCPCLLCCYGMMTSNSHNRNNNNNNPEAQRFLSNDNTVNRNDYGSIEAFTMPKGQFEECVRNVKNEVEKAWTAPRSSNKNSEPHSGLYLTSYVDRTTQVQWDATLNLHFTRDFAGRGYKLSGEGHDVDGHTAIEDGHANYDGTAWWKERTVTGDIGLEVVSRGKFDFAQRTFQGNWLANSGEHAAYMTFRAEQQAEDAFAKNFNPPPSAPPAYAPLQPSAPMAKEDVSVPIMATATADMTSENDIPTVAASSVVEVQNPNYFQ